MADFKIELKNSLNSKMYPKTTLDNIVASVASSTTLITSGGVIKKDFLDLTGLINSSYVSSANIIPASAVSGFETAAKNAASTYVHSTSVIPVNAVSNFAQNVSSGVSSYVYVEGGNCIPQSAVSGLSTALSGKMGTNYEDYIQLGSWLEWQNDNEIGLARYHTITTVTGASVYVQPGEAYVIDATTSSTTINYMGGSSGMFGRESHAEIFVTNEGYVHVGVNVTLVDPLEPDAVNNCTIRFHDGHAIISVEDHVEAYMVNNTSTGSSTSGTLAYGLKQTTGTAYNYIGFRSELNTSLVPTGGAIATVMKHIVGNGMTVGPTITGNLIIKSGATIRDVKLSGVTVTSGNATLTDVYCAGNVTIVSGGMMTLGDAFIQSGSTVTVSGGLVIEKVTGEGSESVIDLGGTYVNVSSGTTASASGCAFSGGNTTGYAGVFYVSKGAHLDLNGCELRAATGTKGQVYTLDAINMTNTVVSASTGTKADIYVNTASGIANFNGGCEIGYCQLDSGGSAVFSGSNTIRLITQFGTSATRRGYVTISSGASINLTSSINPGGTGGITVLTGGCTVNGNFISAGTYTSIKSNGQPT